jgi:hypothetical protein
MRPSSDIDIRARARDHWQRCGNIPEVVNAIQLSEIRAKYVLDSILEVKAAKNGSYQFCLFDENFTIPRGVAKA